MRLILARRNSLARQSEENFITGDRTIDIIFLRHISGKRIPENAQCVMNLLVSISHTDERLRCSLRLEEVNSFVFNRLNFQVQLGRICV